MSLNTPSNNEPKSDFASEKKWTNFINNVFVLLWSDVDFAFSRLNEPLGIDFSFFEIEPQDESANLLYQGFADRQENYDRAVPSW